MKKMATALASFALLLLSTVAAHAQLESLQPQVSYSAQRVMTAGGLTMEGPYYYSPGKHRSEMSMEGQTFTAIVREDRELLWTLMPQQNMYMEVAFDAREVGNGSAFEGSQIVESREVGTEDVNGLSTTKYEVTLRDPSGETASGTLWATAEQIPVKMDMVIEGGEHIVVELRDIEIGPQADELFEVPAGYRKFSLGSLGSLGNLANGFPGAAGNAGAAAQPGAASDDSGFAEEVADEAAEGAKEGIADGVRQGVRQNVGRRIRGIFNRD